MRKQIARQMFPHKLVVRQVVVESADDVVAVLRGIIKIEVVFVPHGVRVANQVEPVPGPAFAIARGFEQPIDKPGVGVGRRVGGKVGDLGGRRRQAGRVKCDATNQRPAVASPPGPGRSLPAGRE